MHTPPYDRTDERIEALLLRARRLLATDPRSSLSAAEDALRLARESSLEQGIARALHGIAEAQAIRSRFSQSLRAAEDALCIYERLGDAAAISAVLIVIGTCHRRTDRLEAAADAFRRSLEGARASGRKKTEAEALYGLGLVELGNRAIAPARGLFARAVEAGRAADAPAAVAAALQGFGLSHFICCEWRKAIEWYEQALAVALPTRDLPLITYIRCNITTSLMRTGDIERALRMERRNLRVLERLGDRRSMRIALNSIALMSRSLGDYDEALKAQIRSLAVAEEMNDRRGIVIVLSNLGELYELFGDDATGLEYFMRGEKIAGEMDDASLQVLMMEHVARNYRRLGMRSKALMHALHALRLARGADDRDGELALLNLLGLLHLDAGDPEKGAQYLERALEAARATSTLDMESQILQSMAAIEEGRGQPARAREHLEQAYAVAVRNHHDEHCHALLERLADSCARAGDHQGSAAYRHAYQRSAATIFSDARVHRIRSLVAEFERSAWRSEAETLQLDAQEMEAAARMADTDLDLRLRKLHRGAAREREGAHQPHGAAAAGRSGVTASAQPRSDSQGIRYRVEAFGALRLWVNDTEITGRAWGRKRARDLFKLLLVRYRRPVTIDEIIEHLWDGKIAEGTELLVMNAISHLRRVLEPGRRAHARSSVIAGINRTYLLDLGDDAAIDIIRFKEAIAEARRATVADAELNGYRRAIALYGDDLLKEDYYADWAAAERELLKDAYLAALESAGNLAIGAGEGETALEYARRLLAADPTSIEGYRIMLAALRSQKRESEIAALYKGCREAFEREYGTDVPSYLAELFAL